jgi:hypothetical protein
MVCVGGGGVGRAMRDAVLKRWTVLAVESA